MTSAQREAGLVVYLGDFLRIVAAVVKRSMTVPRKPNWAMNAFQCSPEGLALFRLI